MFPKSKKLFDVTVFGQKTAVWAGETDQVPWAGCYSPDQKAIWIRDGNKNYMQETLIHEIFEVVWDRCSLGQSALDERTKDILIDVFAKAVKELFIDESIHKKLEKKIVG